jgi:hypothetical protein
MMVGQGTRYTKIGQKDSTLIIHQQIPGLNITMDVIVFV